MKSLFAAIVLMCCGAASAHAQEVEDIVHLKNGSVIRGTVLEVVSAGNVRIQTSDGSLWVFPMDEVDRIAKGQSVLEPNRRPRLQVRNTYTARRKTIGYLLVGAYAATVVTASAMDDKLLGTTVVPVVGPFLTIRKVEEDAGYEFRPNSKELLVASGIVQTALLAYYVSTAMHERRANRRLAFVPTRTGVMVFYRH